MAQALVTGGSGFIGSHLVEGLIARGWQVRVLDNFSTGHRENIKHIISQIDLLEGDVCNLATVRFAARNIDVIFHQAAFAVCDWQARWRNVRTRQASSMEIIKALRYE